MRDGKQKCDGNKVNAVTCAKCPPKTAMLKLQKHLNKSSAFTSIKASKKRCAQKSAHISKSVQRRSKRGRRQNKRTAIAKFEPSARQTTVGW